VDTIEGELDLGHPASRENQPPGALRSVVTNGSSAEAFLKPGALDAGMPTRAHGERDREADRPPQRGSSGHSQEHIQGHGREANSGQVKRCVTVAKELAFPSPSICADPGRFRVAAP
jgi:hypothetical protein